MATAGLVRQVRFYRIDAGDDEHGRPVPFDAVAAFVHVNGLPFDPAREDGRYMGRTGDEAVVACWVESPVAMPVRVRLGFVRRSGLPHVESAGALSPLSIPLTAGLAEQTHMVFLGSNIVGIEVNGRGPRAGKLIEYLRQKGPPGARPLGIEMLIHPSIEEKLNSFGALRRMELRIRPSYAAVLSAADNDLGAAVSAAAMVGKAEEIELVFSSGRRREARLDGRIMKAIKKLVSRNKINEEEVLALKITGRDADTGTMEHLDILHEDIHVTKVVAPVEPRGRAVQSEAMFLAIQEAHSQHRDEIARSAGARIAGDRR